MVGSCMLKKTKEKFHDHEIIIANRKQLDLLNQKDVFSFFKKNKFDLVIDCAAKVGGIHSNNVYRADFIYQNLQIQNNIIHASYLNNVKKLLFLGSSCVYPKFAEQPIKEEYLLTSCLENTNEPYAIAKIAGIKMCESYYKQYGCDFISVMPTNLYGPNDNFHEINAHVLPSLIHKFHLAKQNKSPYIQIWGTGRAKREFMHVEDMVDACLHILQNMSSGDIYSQNISHINIGSGIEISISDLAYQISKLIGYEGELRFDLSKPDGTLRKLLDSSRLNKSGFSSKITLEEGLESTYNWYLKNQDKIIKKA